MKKKPSILRQMLVLLQIQIITVLLVIIFAAGVTVYSTSKQIKTDAAGMLNIYSSEIENRLRQAWQNLSSVVYDNYDLDLLQSDNEQDRYHASQRLSISLQNLMKTNRSAQMMLIADAAYEICLDMNDGSFSFEEKNELRSTALSFAEEKESKAGWQVLGNAYGWYLYRMLKTGRRASVVFIKADSILSGIRASDTQRMQFLLSDREGRICASAGDEILQEKSAENINAIDDKKYFTEAVVLGDGAAGLLIFQRRTEVFRQMKISGLLLVGAAFLLLLFDYYIFRFLRRKLVLPMKEASITMERMSEGETALRLPPGGDTQEFNTLSQTFNHLMDEIVSLKIDSYEKQIALSDAEEKYIRLQIRPHFFLNAMTTIASLSATGHTEEIRTYIDSLSLNIRYMFSSGLHTVPLREEIRHVENYFSMQELKYPDAVFYYLDMPEELGEWPVPQMLIHTLVENEYKYAIPDEGTLTILIRVYTQASDEEGEQMIVIEMEDDGKGYPQEVIDSINDRTNEPDESGSRVGLYSIRKLLNLMYERDDLFYIDNVRPHGAFNRIRIPGKPVHERRRT